MTFSRSISAASKVIASLVANARAAAPMATRAPSSFRILSAALASGPVMLPALSVSESRFRPTEAMLLPVLSVPLKISSTVFLRSAMFSPGIKKPGAWPGFRCSGWLSAEIIPAALGVFDSLLVVVLIAQAVALALFLFPALLPAFQPVFGAGADVIWPVFDPGFDFFDVAAVLLLCLLRPLGSSALLQLPGLPDNVGLNHRRRSR